ncbi:hypothetical protein AHYW_003725 [Providencia manganoxydans]|uniref:carboxymuconolactone decarboxylase family protein n=1 Tax=Providencia manganoxydans TaxID=2923283 RepID=UPI003B99EBB1
MKCLETLSIAVLFTTTASLAQTQGERMLPSIKQLNEKGLQEQVWKRQELSKRDRHLVTIASAIARNEPSLLKTEMNLGLDSGLTPEEINGMITHLAIYAGYGKALEASNIAQEVFNARNIDVGALIDNEPQLFAIDAKAEAARLKAVDEATGGLFEHLADDTTNVLFNDLWLRPDLTPRDRSLITVTALLANGQVGQIGFHLNKAMDNGLTATQAEEVLSHLAYYVGWPNAFSAIPVMKEVIQNRSQSN